MEEVKLPLEGIEEEEEEDPTNVNFKENSCRWVCGEGGRWYLWLFEEMNGGDLWKEAWRGLMMWRVYYWFKVFLL